MSDHGNLQPLQVVLFGAVRNFPSIRSNLDKLIENLRVRFDVNLHLSVVDDEVMLNPRSSECGVVNRDGLADIPWSTKAQCSVDVSDEELQSILRYGDVWRDNGRSITNILKQFSTLEAYWSIAAERKAENTRHLLLRADLDYVEPHRLANEVNKNTDRDVYVPSWQGWRAGYNDRLAICNSALGLRAYCSRRSNINMFLRTMREDFHSERYLKWALKTHCVTVGYFHSKAVRVRIDGKRVKEKNHGKVRITLGEAKSDLLKVLRGKS